MATAAYTIQQPPPLPVPDTDEDKRLFAAAWLRTNSTLDAAKVIEPVNVGRAMRISNEWKNDPVVLEEKARLVEEMGEESFLPTKAVIARDIHDTAMIAKSRGDLESYEKLLKLHLSMRGMIDKPGSAPIQIAMQSVMVVASQGDDDDWERKAARSQARLIQVNDD